MRPIRILNRITPPFLWDIAKRVIGRSDDGTVPSFLDPSVGSHSQYGEDLILDALLGSPALGTYVDVGANDPAVLSNTRRFHERGWNGLNIEPNSELCAALASARPGDITLNIGIAPEAGSLTFYKMDPSTLSTFDKGAARDNLAHPGARMIEEVEVLVEPLSQVLDTHLAGRTVDFLSVDTEGLDLAVLQSNDWHKHRPRLVLVEVAWEGAEIIEYLGSQDYAFLWSNAVNGIFADETLSGDGARAGIARS
ncbi:MAG: FkbM family methyltransferase [Actinobacteria bacterium]|nr:FkbM family methyltransferase [Actinomycetota bacterium]MCG2808450.1 FkbM family methyltransferase [Coriobacteriia bacterium]